MASSSSNIANNLAERIYKIERKYRRDNKKSERFGMKLKYCKRCLEYTNVKD